jgi:hypothetical protein
MRSLRSGAMSVFCMDVESACLFPSYLRGAMFVKGNAVNVCGICVTFTFSFGFRIDLWAYDCELLGL